MIEYIEAKKSPIDGKGVFATQNLKEGGVICILEGVVNNFEIEERKFLSGDNRVTCDNLQVGFDTYITLSETQSLINHSCDPNSAVNKERKLIAIKAISAGTEITFDYSTVEWTSQKYISYDQNKWPMNCRCGSNKCRQLITCFPYLPQSLKDFYVNREFLQEFILAKMSWSDEEQRCYVCEKKRDEHMTV